jgi:gallate decarboxylase subunit D
MKEKELCCGSGRTAVNLRYNYLGEDVIVQIFNQGAHLGAVAIGEYDSSHQRASVSVVTRLGHKEDGVAHSAAHRICKTLKKPVCVIAGIHLEAITAQEMDQVQRNADGAVDALVQSLQ